ncbi:hypothetical protein [Flavobacterium gilvum]|uniref:DUF3575 domain-containing protein n=1 Tax=Flavobacterium gilvum TaxID=1492737 RepID=A0AAC9I3V3_9FLAO|nr:hypothetical protein [Flavobacterium gilvum]AOW09844.1 hypothetical protein EM308_10185 [Flavobacterium gilvum]KFC58062.1 hypothetical protein FEM08_31300 [Flavobacterium gilvum]
MKIFSTPAKIVFIFLFALSIFSVNVFSQTAPRDFKNSIKFNVSNTLLYDNSIQFSYERMIKENQSLNVFAGYQEFPLITLNVTNVDFSKDSNRKGYSVGADYRFYLGSINKFKGPRGVYLAPFLSFFQFDTDRNLSYRNPNNGVVSTSNLSSKFNLTNIGGELGYQFVLWDRFVIDCVLFGPSITRYKFNTKLDNNIPGLDDNELYQKVIEAIKDRFPGVEGITGDEGVEKKGVQSITAVGFRYNISIGYRF